MVTRGPSEEACDVVIVGLGPVGAVFANLLGAAGLRVAVFERDADIVPIPRAVGFDDEIMRVFQTLGLTDALLPILRVGTGGQYVAPSGEVAIRRPVLDAEGPQAWRPRYNFHQPNLERILRASLARFSNLSVYLRHEVYAVDEFPDAVSVRVEDMSSGALKIFRARFVVGCDGARSLVRRLIGSRMDDLGLHEPWVVADFVLKRDPGLPPISTQFCHPSTPVTYVHVIGNRRRMEFKLPAGTDPRTAANAENVWALAQRWLTPDDAELERAAFYTFHSLIAQQWRRGRLIIAGDSAHQTPPFLGQGLCAGVRDAVNLAWKLMWILQRHAPLTLLDSYGLERAPHAVAFVDGAVKIGSILKSRDADEMRQLATEIGPSSNVLRNPTPRLGAGIDQPTPSAGKLSAQPRLADGRRLDDEIGYRFALLATPECLRALTPEDTEVIRRLDIGVLSATDKVSAWLGELNAVAVVLRPDRYIFADLHSPKELGGALRSLATRLGADSLEARA